LHGVEAKHIESVPVKETIQGKTVWDDIVEVFKIRGHPKTDRVYPWSHETVDPKKLRRHVTVLHIAPVLSAEAAVKAAIVKEFRIVSQKKPKKIGRPKLPKGEAKGRIVPVRFTAQAIKSVEQAAKAKKQTVSEWIRGTLDAALHA
jgi:hypothetical protein